MLKRLAAAGLIERTRRVGDERVIDNKLSPTGLELRAELLRAQEHVVCQSHLPTAELDALRHRLQALANNLCGVQEDVSEPA